jgi:hypothetical protein
MVHKYIFVADFFADEVPGGGEINNEELINILVSRGNLLLKRKSQSLKVEDIRAHSGSRFIIANFVGLAEDVKIALSQEDYIIYEHDHKYLLSRNPAIYENYEAPKEKIINFAFYKSAQAVLCQSVFHKMIVGINLGIDNIVSLSGNLWSEEILELLKELSEIKKDGHAIMESAIPHKNTSEAVMFCRATNKQYNLIPSLPYRQFLTRMAECEKLVFFPRSPETLSRISVEARMLNMGVITNELCGAKYEEWFSLKGSAMIEKVLEMRESIPNLVEGSFE